MEASEIPNDGNDESHKQTDASISKDYINVPSRPYILKILNKQGDKIILFADKVLKFTGSGKIKRQILILTEFAVYFFDPITDTLKRRIALAAVERVVLSEVSDNFLAIIIPTEYDVLMASTRKIEIVNSLVGATKSASDYELDVLHSNRFEYHASADLVKEVQFEEVEGGVGRGRGAAAGQNPNNVILGAGPAAEGEDAPPVVNIMAAIAEDEPLQAIVAGMRARFGDLDVQHDGDVKTGDYTVEDMKAVLVESINGDTVLPEQRVRAGFLRSDQRLVLPYALGMLPDADFAGYREIPRDATLSTRYYQAGTLTYATIRNYMIEGTPYATIRAEVAARNPVGEALHGTVARWNTDEFYTYDNNRTDPEGVINVVFTCLSIALGFNCDIRDTMSLAVAGGRCSDGAWKTLNLVTDARLALRLRTFSMVSIAALNYGPTGNSALGGWIRAYGTSTCLLPPPASKCLREYKFTKSQPTQALRTVVCEYKKEHTDNLHPLCMNILAMFGLLHLNKEHTYRPTDMNMNRICDSYIDTLGSLVNEFNTDFLKQAKEIVCRTAPHPFGLAQTYFLAKVMWKYSFLSAPLMTRHDVAPPPIQRFMIIQSMIKQWSSLPAGRKLNDAFGELITIIDAEVARIRANPPSYSALHLCYDIPEMVTPDARAWRAVEALMPCVYGFANVFHGQDQDKSEGVALAMSLKNVERDAKAIAMMFVNLWEEYLDSTETDGLVNLAISSARLLGPGGADATVQ